MNNHWPHQNEWNAREMRNYVDNVLAGTVYLASCIFFAIFFFFFGTLNFSKIIVGTLYLYECPCQPMLPIFLVVSGGVGLAICYMSNQQMSSRDLPISIWLKLLCVFHNFWFIAGSVWTFTLTIASSTPGDPQYCDRKLYLFTICVVVLTSVLFALITLSACAQACGWMRVRRAAAVQDRRRMQQGHWRGPA